MIDIVDDSAVALFRRRLRAAAIHLAITSALVGAFVALALGILYPPPLLALQGGIKIVTLLVVAEVVLGPLLTLVVFKPDKKYLAFDLAIIAIIQLAAFVYGAYAIVSQRPAYMAFSVNRFFVVSAADVEGIPPPSVSTGPQYGSLGPKVVFVKPSPEDSGGWSATFGVLLGDPSNVRQANNYEAFPYSLDTLSRETLVAADVLPYYEGKVERIARHAGKDPDAMYYFQVKGGSGKGIAVVDSATGHLVGIVEGDLEQLAADGSDRAR